MPRKHITQRKNTSSKTLLIIVVVCIVTIAAVILLTKERLKTASPSEASSSSSTIGSAETALNSLLDEGKPVFVFYHSTDCHTCKVMMATVADIYSEFEDEVALVDVDVYDSNNKNLLQQAQINSIPTQMFINSDGEKIKIIGVMEPEELRQHLAALADG